MYEDEFTENNPDTNEDELVQSGDVETHPGPNPNLSNAKSPGRKRKKNRGFQKEERYFVSQEFSHLVTHDIRNPPIGLKNCGHNTCFINAFINVIGSTFALKIT